MRYLVVALLLVSCSKQIQKVQQQTASAAVKELPPDQYYISANGNSLNSGFSESQCWDITKANTHEFKPGDVINIVGTVTGSLSLTESGTAEKPILIRGGKIFSGRQNGIKLYNCGNIIIRNVWLQGEGEISTTLDNNGIMMWLDDRQSH